VRLGTRANFPSLGPGLGALILCLPSEYPVHHAQVRSEASGLTARLDKSSPEVTGIKKGSSDAGMHLSCRRVEGAATAAVPPSATFVCSLLTTVLSG